MVGPIRKPLQHPTTTIVITERSLDLFEQGLRHQRRGDDIPADLGYEFVRELRLAPWAEDPLDCSSDEPPDWYSSDQFALDDYQRSRALRLQLEQLVKDRRRARREARQRQAAVVSDPASPPAPSDQSPPSV